MSNPFNTKMSPIPMSTPDVHPFSGHKILYVREKQYIGLEKANWMFGNPTHRVISFCLWRWAVLWGKHNGDEEPLKLWKDDFHTDVFGPHLIHNTMITPQTIGKVVSLAVPYRWSRQIMVARVRKNGIAMMSPMDLRYGMEWQIGYWFRFYWKMYLGNDVSHLSDITYDTMVEFLTEMLPMSPEDIDGLNGFDFEDATGFRYF